MQRSDANTGGNHSRIGGAPEPGWWQGPASIRTGRATAIGSQDSTQLDQQAATRLTGDATADIVQIAIVFNIGAAVATTGSNELAAGGGGSGGAISTGDATAIGNDAETYVTQGAGADAGPDEREEVSQRVMTLQIGIATSDTGRNTIVASLSSGEAGIATGDATAIGNQSSSTITQEALADGSGTAHLTIQQRATIVNLGLALANTGQNQVGDMVATALDLDDPEAARRLIELVVPQLIAAANGGSGTIDTGDALAIGNRSTTELHQVAVGTADSGEVWIDQNAVVVNAGVAAANTGQNGTGGGAGAAPLDAEAEAEAAVAELSTFLTDLLNTIDTWAEGGEADLGASSLSTTVGGVTISIDGSLVPTSGDVDDLATTIRQLTAVINLAAALASSGENTMIVIEEGSAGAATGGDGSSSSSVSVGSAVIITGDATASNESVVMVCQLHNVEGVECLAPEEPAADTAVDPAVGPVQPAGAPTHAAGIRWESPSVPASITQAADGTAQRPGADTTERQPAGRQPAQQPDRLGGQMREDMTTSHGAAARSMAVPAQWPDRPATDGGGGTPLLPMVGVVALSGALAALVIVRRKLL